MNVELWSGNPHESKAVAEQGLRLAPHNRQYLEGRRRAVDAIDRTRPWEVSATESYDWFSDRRAAWHEQVLGRHKALLGNPRYGIVGLFAMPFYVIFEAIGPIIEFTGLVITVLAVALGLLDMRFATLMFLAAVADGSVFSVSAVLLEEASSRRYPRLRDLLVLCAVGVLENFGYRQLTTWWRLRGVVDYFRKREGWGEMTRKGFVRP